MQLYLLKTLLIDLLMVECMNKEQNYFFQYMQYKP